MNGHHIRIAKDEIISSSAKTVGTQGNLNLQKIGAASWPPRISNR